VQPLVARPGFKSVGHKDAGPALLGQVQDALRIGFAKPRRRVELKSERVVGGVARGSDHHLSPRICSSECYSTTRYEDHPDICPGHRRREPKWWLVDAEAMFEETKRLRESRSQLNQQPISLLSGSAICG